MAGSKDHLPDNDRLAVDLAKSELRLIRDLSAIRRERGIKPAELARRMGVDRSLVARFEAGGTNPTMGTINRYAEALGVLITHSVVRDDETPSAPGEPAVDTGTVAEAAKEAGRNLLIEILEVSAAFTPYAETADTARIRRLVGVPQ